ncbi:thiopeptide-type bacteriocin biosynthesis domain-containing protein [Dyadobacter sp. SG02]|nr:thiopeptide-type bacteriocin biosynthesis domain-containing protein [Dyadobacter sp. SG02]
MLRRINMRLAQNPGSLKLLLCQAYKRHVIREALYLASPELYGSLLKLEETASNEPGEQKVMLSLYKYLARATSRCTPFGLFAGYFVATLSDYSHIRFTGRIKKHTTLSGEVLQQIAGQLRGTNLEDTLDVNSSLYMNGSFLRFAQRVVSQNGGFEFALKEVCADQFLIAAKSVAQHGTTASTVVDALGREGLSHREAKDFVSQLRAEQILVDVTEPMVSQTTFQNVLESHAHTNRLLTKVFRDVTALSKMKQGGPARFAPLEASLKNAGLTWRNPVQIDMEIETSYSTVSRRTVAGIVSDLEKLIGTTENRIPVALKSFATRFYQRYGDKQVPLLQVLDPALGIGYGNIESSYFGHVPVASGGEGKQTQHYSAIERVKLIDRAYHEARHSNRKFYLLNDEDLALVRPEKPPRIAEGISVLGSVFTSDEHTFDEGKYLFELRGISGPGSLNLISRFADADTLLAERLITANARETTQHPNAIVVQVDFVPPGRDANVARRPDLGNSHLTLLSGKSDAGKTIAASDLLVSVRAGQVILTSASMQKRIIPRVTTAYNPRLGPPVYQFLADIAAGETALSPLWDWGHLSELPFLPRIQYKGIVLQKACWNLDSSAIPASELSDQELVNWWRKLEKDLGLPRYVQIGAGDQLLSIDGHSAPAVRICLNKLRKDKKLRIYEALHALKYSFLQTDRKYYFNEIVIPILNHCKTNSNEPLVGPQKLESTRWVSSKDGWTYLKIYASEETCERLLTGKLFDFCMKLQKSNRINGWFFLRFKDPDPHIRLRLFTGPGKKRSTGFGSSMAKDLKDEIESGLVFRFQSELYERELERYSSIAYEHIESIFCSDSLAIASSLALLHETGRQQQRWLAALMACDGLLNAFGKYHPQIKIQTLQAAGSVLEKSELISLNQQFRQQKQQIACAMSADDYFLSDVRQLLEERNSKIMDILAGNPLNDPGKQQALLIDLMHLCCNRLFISDQRRQEHAIYHFLKKFYDYQLNSKNSLSKT